MHPKNAASPHTMPIAALHCTVGLAPGLGAVRRPFAQRCRGWGACARPRIQLCKASEGDGLKPVGKLVQGALCGMHGAMILGVGRSGWVLWDGFGIRSVVWVE